MSLFEFFDRVYVLNLDRRTDRWGDVSKELGRVGLSGKVLRISGVESQNPKAGCSKGHLKCLKAALDDGSKRPLFLEDDVRFLMSAPEALGLAGSSIPKDWEIFYLGYNLDPAPSPTPPPEFFGPHLLRLHGCLTTHAYSVNGKVLETVAAKFEAAIPSESPPDIILSSIELKAYGAYPMVAYQADGFSDIELENVKYTLKENVESVLNKHGVKRPSL